MVEKNGKDRNDKKWSSKMYCDNFRHKIFWKDLEVFFCWRVGTLRFSKLPCYLADLIVSKESRNRFVFGVPMDLWVDRQLLKWSTLLALLDDSCCFFSLYFLGGGNSNIFYFHPCLEKIPILTNIFQMGWNHQPVFVAFVEKTIHAFTTNRHFFFRIHFEKGP